MKKNKIFFVIIIVAILIIVGVTFKFTNKSNVDATKISSVKKDAENQNYTINYALNHYKSYDEFLKDNQSIQWVLKDQTYVLKGDGSSKHSGGWTFKEGEGPMIQSGHQRGKVDYIVTTDNRDVTTLGAIKKAFNQK